MQCAVWFICFCDHFYRHRHYRSWPGAGNYRTHAAIRERVFTAAERLIVNRAAPWPPNIMPRASRKRSGVEGSANRLERRHRWQDVEVSAKESGAPVISFHGRARELYEQTGATSAHIRSLIRLSTRLRK